MVVGNQRRLPFSSCNVTRARRLKGCHETRWCDYGRVFLLVGPALLKPLDSVRLGLTNDTRARGDGLHDGIDKRTKMRIWFEMRCIKSRWRLELSVTK